MDSSMTFRIDSQVKEQMIEICSKLGMTPSTAINIFVNAFVNEKGMPFPVRLKTEMLEDTDNLLKEFALDYERMKK